MKVSAISFSSNASTKNGANKNVTFKGITTRLPFSKVETWTQFHENFKALTHAKYYEALDDAIYPQNKRIRQDNFAFLTQPSYVPELKRSVVDWFKDNTGFPDLKKVTTTIVREFVSRSEESAQANGTKIAGIGFDCTSSVGLQKALPGSDVDKAYVILDDNSQGGSLVSRFKGGLWENVNQLFMSLNHRDTFPEVFTKGQIKSTLARIDDVVVRKMDLSTPKQQKYIHNILHDTTPKTAGEFNIELARHLPDNGLTKEEVKNFAYFLESVKHGYSIKPSMYMETELFDTMQRSPFATFSNVTQMKAHDILLSSGQKQIKTKLRNREGLAHEFDTFGLDKQYRFVIDMIKNVSEDQSSEFAKYYQNDDNIKERYDALNRLLV